MFIYLFAYLTYSACLFGLFSVCMIVYLLCFIPLLFVLLVCLFVVCFILRYGYFLFLFSYFMCLFVINAWLDLFVLCLFACFCLFVYSIFSSDVLTIFVFVWARRMSTLLGKSWSHCSTFDPRSEKTNNGVSEQGRHKPSCNELRRWINAGNLGLRKQELYYPCSKIKGADQLRS